MIAMRVENGRLYGQRIKVELLLLIDIGLVMHTREW